MSTWIVGVDGSDASVDALAWAARHAPLCGADLTVVSSFHVPAVMALMTAKRGFGVDELGLAATAGHDIDVAVERVGEQLGNELVVTQHVVEGQAAHVLVDASADADALVIGQRGSGDLRHHRLGSVSRYCATHSTVPVVVIPSADGSTGPVAEAGGGIVVGFDGSENAEAALRWAIAFGAATGKQVHVVGAVDVAPWLGESTTREHFPDQVAQQEAELVQAIDVIDSASATTRSIVLDSPRQALAAAAASAELVVVGARGRGLIAAELLGSVSTWLLQDAAIPVVVVPDGN